MSRNAVVLMLLVVTFVVLLVAEPLPVHAAATIIQQNNGGCVSTCPSTTLALAFSSNVVAGDVIVAGVYRKPSSFSPSPSISDSFGSFFTQAVTRNDGGDEVTIYYATLSSSGADTVTAILPNTAGGGPLGHNLYIYEVSGVTTAGAATGSGAGSGTSISTSSVTFQSGAFLLSLIGTENPARSVTPGLGSGLTLSSDNSGTDFSHAMYATSGVSSPTTFPATGASSGIWAEAALALNPAPPIPEYSLGLPLLVIFMLISYGLIKRRTRNSKSI
jgi:hypothetical protein